MLRRPPVRGLGDAGANYQAQGSRRRGLDIIVIGADIADVRKGESDDLTGIGGIGHDLLIAGHAGVEAHFADAHALGADSVPPKDATVSQDEGSSRTRGHQCHLERRTFGQLSGAARQNCAGRTIRARWQPFCAARPFT